MRKTIFMAGAAALMLSMGACNSKSCEHHHDDDVVKVYTGVMPAADCDGIRYTLTLEYDHHDNDGDYRLVETYLQADTTATLGYKDLRSFNSEGDFKIEKRGDKSYIKLLKDHKDSQAGSAADQPVYFLVDSDSTITMTNADLEVSQTPGMNYTLKLGN